MQKSVFVQHPRNSVFVIENSEWYIKKKLIVGVSQLSLTYRQYNTCSLICSAVHAREGRADVAGVG